MSDARRIGAQIKRFRGLAGLSKSELARRLRVSPTAVHNWEENGVMPRLEVLIEMERVLEVDLIQIMTGKDGADGEPASYAMDSTSRRDRIEKAREEIAMLFNVSADKVEIVVRT